MLCKAVLVGVTNKIITNNKLTYSLIPTNFSNLIICALPFVTHTGFRMGNALHSLR